MNQTNYGFSGKHHTEEIKEKIRISNIGQKRSEEAKEKMRLAKLGKKLSEEHRKNLSLARIGNKNSFGKKWSKEARAKQSLYLKNNTYAKGKKWSNESKEKISKVSKLRFRDPLYREKNLKHLDEMQIRGNWKTETIIKERLNILAISYKRGRVKIGLPEEIKKLEPSLDFVLDDYKILIEADGCYYHYCTCVDCLRKIYMKPPNKSQLIHIQRDQQINNAVQNSEGWKLIRIWEHDIKRKDFDAKELLDLINYTLQSSEKIIIYDPAKHKLRQTTALQKLSDFKFPFIENPAAVY